MGRHAQSTWIIRVLAIVLATMLPAHAFASANAIAPGVALNASAGCRNGNLDITLTTVGANRESWRGTNSAGATLTQGEGPASAGLQNFSGTFTGFRLEFSPLQPADTLIGSYAYIGETPPDAANTAEFFIFYKCSLAGAEVLLSCFGPYGRCPQTAQQAMAQIAAGPRIPVLGPLTLALMAMLVAGAGGLALARRT
jgi:hypothetical protein